MFVIGGLEILWF